MDRPNEKGKKSEKGHLSFTQHWTVSLCVSSLSIEPLNENVLSVFLSDLGFDFLTSYLILSNVHSRLIKNRQNGNLPWGKLTCFQRIRIFIALTSGARKRFCTAKSLQIQERLWDHPLVLQTAVLHLCFSPFSLSCSYLFSFFSIFLLLLYFLFSALFL